MAIIRPGPLVGGISGTVGGLVFVAGKRSPTVRPRPAPSFKSSTTLQPARSRFAQLMNHWRGLTDDEKAAWATSAVQYPTTNALGVTSPTTGFRHFISTNTRRRFDASDVPDLPNIAGQDTDPEDVAAVFSVAGTYSITANSGPRGLGLFYLYGQAFPRNWPAKAAPRLRFLFIQFGSSINVNVKPFWTPLFGEIQEDQQFVVGVAYARATRFLSNTVMSPHLTAVA